MGWKLGDGSLGGRAVNRFLLRSSSLSVEDLCLFGLFLVARSGLRVVIATTRGSGLGAMPAGMLLGPSGWEGKEGKWATEREGTACSGISTATAAVFITEGLGEGSVDGRRVPRSLIGGGGGGCAEVGGMSGNIGTAAIGTELGNGGCITLLGSGKDCFARGGFLPRGGGCRRGGGGEGSTRVATSK